MALAGDREALDKVDVEHKNVALRILAAAGNVAAVKLLLQSGADNIGRALEDAVGVGQDEIVCTLLEHDVRPLSLATALEVAAKAGQGSIARRLINAGAQPSDAALAEAVVNRDFALASIILDAGATPSGESLCHAAELGPWTLVRAMLDKGADPNYQRAALRYVSRFDQFHAEVAGRSALVRQWDNEYTRDDRGLTPLAIAVRRGNAEAAESLLSRGARPDAQVILDEGGIVTTPLIVAVCSKRAAIVQLLLLHGADPFLPDEDGVMPATHADLVGGREILDILHSAPPRPAGSG